MAVLRGAARGGDRQELQHMRARADRERRGRGGQRDGEVRGAAVGRSPGRGRCLHRSERDLHQRPRAEVEAVPGGVRTDDDKERSVDRRERYDSRRAYDRGARARRGRQRGDEGRTRQHRVVRQPCKAEGVRDRRRHPPGHGVQRQDRQKT